VTIHQGGTVNSFATPAAHGAVFLAATADDGEVGLAEDLVHQGGHVLFTAITADPSVFFKVPPDTPVSAITGASADSETRNLNEALHGFFTEAAMILFLHRLLDLEGLTARQAHEALGRLAYISSRTTGDLAELSRPGLFTEHGLGILQLCRSALAETIECRRAQLVSLDLSDQPYAFSYGIFTARNPLVR
jgi:hypothetical protein